MKKNSIKQKAFENQQKKRKTNGKEYPNPYKVHFEILPFRYVFKLYLLKINNRTKKKQEQKLQKSNA